MPIMRQESTRDRAVLPELRSLPQMWMVTRPNYGPTLEENEEKKTLENHKTHYYPTVKACKYCGGTDCCERVYLRTHPSEKEWVAKGATYLCIVCGRVTTLNEYEKVFIYKKRLAKEEMKLCPTCGSPIGIEEEERKNEL